MPNTRFSFALGGLALCATTLLSLSFMAAPAQEPSAQEPDQAERMLPKDSKALKAIAASKAIYVGVSKCKSCHNKEAMGKIYAKWEETKHHEALDGLKSDDALRYGKEVGIEKPWEADACLKCHITAYETPKEKRHKRFKMNLGVQCESCHGPGSIHIKARLKAAKEGKKAGVDLSGLPKGVPEGEIILPDEGLCRSCHNEDSPSFKKFDFGERLEKIRHLHPLRKEPRVKPREKKKDEAEAESKQ